MSALPLASTRLRKLRILCLNDLLDGDLWTNFFYLYKQSIKNRCVHYKYEQKNQFYTNKLTNHKTIWLITSNLCIRKAVKPEFWHGDDWQNVAFAAQPSTVPLFHTYEARSTSRSSTRKSRMQPTKLLVRTTLCLAAEEKCPDDRPPSWKGPVRSRNRWQVSVTSRHLNSTQICTLHYTLENFIVPSLQRDRTTIHYSISWG